MDSRFADLEVPLQNRFLNTSIRVVFLDEGTTIETRQEIFKRINTGGQHLKPSEVRRGSYEGPFKVFLEDCAKNKLFDTLAPRTEKIEKHYEGLELVTRFFAYTDSSTDDYIGYDGKVRQFLDKYVEKMNVDFKKNPNLRQEYQDRFENMLNFAKKLLQDLGFKKSSKAKSTPRARFEALSIGIYLALQQNPKLKPLKNDKWLESDTFKYPTRSDAANNKSRLLGRIEYVRDVLLGEVS